MGGGSATENIHKNKAAVLFPPINYEIMCFSLMSHTSLSFPAPGSASPGGTHFGQQGNKSNAVSPGLQASMQHL